MYRWICLEGTMTQETMSSMVFQWRSPSQRLLGQPLPTRKSFEPLESSKMLVLLSVGVRIISSNVLLAGTASMFRFQNI